MNYNMFLVWQAMFKNVIAEITKNPENTLFTHDQLKKMFEFHLKKEVKVERVCGYVHDMRKIMEIETQFTLNNIRGEGWTLINKDNKKVKIKKEVSMESASMFAPAATKRSKWSPAFAAFALRTVHVGGRTKESYRIIADKVEVSEGSVSQALLEFGKACKDPRYSNMNLEEAMTKYFADGRVHMARPESKVAVHA